MLCVAFPHKLLLFIILFGLADFGPCVLTQASCPTFTPHCAAWFRTHFALKKEDLFVSEC